MSYIKGGFMKTLVAAIVFLFVFPFIAIAEEVCTEQDKLKVKSIDVEYCCKTFSLKPMGILNCNVVKRWNTGWIKRDLKFNPPYTIIPVDK
jgi:hypothetical protein